MKRAILMFLAIVVALIGAAAWLMANGKWQMAATALGMLALMTNEVNFSAALSATKNGSSVSVSGAGQQDLTDNVLFTNVQNIGTTAEAIDFGEAAPSTVGYLFLKNLDATNYVEIGLNSDSTFSAAKFSKIKPGKVALIPLVSTTTLYLKANTAACNVQVVAVGADV